MQRARTHRARGSTREAEAGQPGATAMSISVQDRAGSPDDREQDDARLSHGTKHEVADETAKMRLPRISQRARCESKNRIHRLVHHEPEHESEQQAVTDIGICDVQTNQSVDSTGENTGGPVDCRSD